MDVVEGKLVCKEVLPHMATLICSDDVPGAMVADVRVVRFLTDLQGANIDIKLKLLSDLAASPYAVPALRAPPCELQA
jgi:hypothetical protein